jgi:hypothetical protein
VFLVNTRPHSAHMDKNSSQINPVLFLPALALVAGRGLIKHDICHVGSRGISRRNSDVWKISTILTSLRFWRRVLS